jgi:hypothetical protein
MNYYAPAKCPGSGCTWANETEASTHFNYIAKVVDDLNPDIINFCEVEGMDELNLLRSRMAGGAGYVAFLIPGTDSSTGQNVGLMTKLAYNPTKDLTRTEDRVAYPLAGSNCGYTGANGTVGLSKHYFTEYSFYGRRTLIAAAHLLAYPEDPTRCAEREAQASIIQNYVAEYIAGGGEAIVLGDFNDFDGAVLDANGNRPTSRVLDILKSSGVGLSAAEWVPQSDRYTDWWDKNADGKSSADEFSMIDHVLMTPFLFERIAGVSMYHGYAEYEGKYDSDHYPVVVDFLV